MGKIDEKSTSEKVKVEWPADRVERRAVADLVPYARNARTHSDEQIAQIAASIREWGWTTPVLVDEENTLIAGHGRVMAAQKLGITDIPALVARGWSEAQKKAYVIADNKLALNAGWDESLLRVELMELGELDFDLGLMGFDEDEITGLLEIGEEDEEAAGLTDPDDAPEPEKVATSKPGDIWILGKHRLMVGDSTLIDQVEQLMGGVQADLLLTDPPYNVNYQGKTKSALKIDNDKLGDADFRQFLRDAFSAADAVMKPGAVFYIWHADMESANFRGACADVEWQVRQGLIWVKDSMVLSRQDYHWKHEPCLYGWKGGSGHLWASDRKQTTILEFARPKRNEEHPTMKPVALFEYQLTNNTKGGDVVLDLFGGSGTTAIAAEMNGRVARLMEMDPIYADVIVRRWQAFTGKQAVNEATGEAFVEPVQPEAQAA